ncbi:MAG: nucleotide exchange factor GrpE, partial [Bacteroidetes bacterium]
MQEDLKDKEQETPEVDAQEVDPQAETPQVEQEEQAKEGQSEQEAPTDEVSFGSLEEAMEALANLQLKLRTTEAALKTQQEQYLRLQADFQNFRKRKERETTDMIRFANQDLIRELLPVLDNFDRTLDAIEKTDNLTAVKEGIALVDQSMKRQLQKIGLEPIEAKGKEFDSTWHEAVTTIPAPDESQQGIVMDEIEKGYKLKERVI